MPLEETDPMESDPVEDLGVRRTKEGKPSSFELVKLLGFDPEAVKESLVPVENPMVLETVLNAER